MSKLIILYAAVLAVVIQTGATTSTIAFIYINTEVGSGAPGSGGDGGYGFLAQLDTADDVAFDGNVYISDSTACRIRRLGGNGIISTFAGTGACGFSGDGGPATAAALQNPHGIIVYAGYLYIADTGNGRIRRVSIATGTIETVHLAAGVTDVGIDASGVMYGALRDSHQVYRWTDAADPGAPVAGTGIPGSSGDGGYAERAQLNLPERVTLDPSGNLYIADTGNCRIRMVAAWSGIITNVAGTGVCGFGGDDGFAGNAMLNHPGGLEMEHNTGDLVFADTGNHRIRKIEASTGLITTLAGTGVAGFSGDYSDSRYARLNTPRGIALKNSVDGRFYLADSANHRIRQVTSYNDDVPFAADMDGDGKADLLRWTLYGDWKWLTSSSGYNTAASITKQWGSRGDVPLLADMDGDGKSDLIVWRPSTGTWYWTNSSTGLTDQVSKAFGDRAFGDIPLVGEFDGDGKADLVIWRARNGTWYWLLSSTGYDTAAVQSKQWGSENHRDVPMLADVDGDGRSDLLIWRKITYWWWAKTGMWFWLTSSTGYDYAEAGIRQWGSWLYLDQPLPADLDGDRKADLVVWRQTDAMWYWLPSVMDYEVSAAALRQWGDPSPSIGDKPTVADFDGDGLADLGIWRARTGTWYWLTSSVGFDYNNYVWIQWGSTRLPE